MAPSRAQEAARQSQLPVDPETVFAALHEAGRLVVQMQEAGLSQVEAKTSEIDLVTEADLASEQLLRERLHALDPRIGFWGEESNQRPDTPLAWLVDPIDGTVNYAAGLPVYAITLALVEDLDTILFGATLFLPPGELFWAIRGQGAYRRLPDGREQRLRVNRVARLRDALLSTGFPYHRAEHPDNNRAEFSRLVSQCRGVRRVGSIAVDLAWVAAGIFAAHWEGWFNPWDVAAGVLLVREAGGRVTDYRGAEYVLGTAGIIAGNGQDHLHHRLLEEIQAARRELPQIHPTFLASSPAGR